MFLLDNGKQIKILLYQTIWLTIVILLSVAIFYFRNEIEIRLWTKKQ
jgi:hypothetical protein